MGPAHSSGSERAGRLAAEVARRGLDAVIVGDLVRPGDSSRDAMASVTWLTGFTGTSGCAIVPADGAPRFITDFRYAASASASVGEPFEVVIAKDRLIPEIAGSLSGRVGFDPTTTSVRIHDRLTELAASVGFEPVAGLCEELRRQKDAGEVERIRAACELGDELYRQVFRHGLALRTEHEVALQIETGARELGAEGVAFPPIVAAGPNGALPHAVPGEREIAPGELVVIDLGVILDGYCSDCTRTLAAGAEPDPEAADAYATVLRAQRAALAGLRSGIGGDEADALARDVIEAAGLGDAFGHGLGHGVGVQVHEAPRLGRTSEDELAEGDVVTIEPGVYVEGRFGIRIEDLVHLGPDGPEVLTGLETELTVV